MDNGLSIYTTENFGTAKEVATALASSDLVPAHFQKKPANVLLALEFANRNNIAPFAAMQSMFVISGKVGMSAAMAISLARKHNVWKALKYTTKGQGADMAVTATATLHDGEQVSQTVTMQMAIADGWTKNPKYKSLPELMLQYRAATFLIRTHFPEVLSGMQTIEELRDVEAAKSNAPSVVDVTVVTPTAPAPVEPSKRSRASASAPVQKPAVEQSEASAEEKSYLVQLLDRLESKAPDVDVADAIKRIRGARIRLGAVRALHQPLMQAVEGKGLENLETWMSAAIIEAPRIAPATEEIPF